MSITDAPESDTCEQCGRRFDLPNHRPNHCSDRCYYRDKGEKVINQVESEGPICSNCYGKVRETMPAKAVVVRGPDHPGREDRGPKNVADALQFPTTMTTWGVDDFADDEYSRLEDTRWSCNCGAVNPNESHGFMQASPRFPTRKNLLRALTFCHERGAIEHKPDAEAFRDAIKAGYFDLAYAAGRSVYGGDRA